MSELEELLRRVREAGGWGSPREARSGLHSAALPGLQMKSPEKKRRKSNTQVNGARRWGRFLAAAPVGLGLASGAERRESVLVLALSPNFLTNAGTGGWGRCA